MGTQLPEAGLGVNVALSATRTAAPAFVAAALDPGVLAAFVEDGRLFTLTEGRLPPELAGRRPSEVARTARWRCGAGRERLATPRRPVTAPSSRRSGCCWCRSGTSPETRPGPAQRAGPPRNAFFNSAICPAW